MPKLWNDTVQAHRREVRDAILDTTATLVAEHGLRSVTMSQIAEQTGIGRATLYKYFRDVDGILVAWHDRHVTIHLEQLAAARDKAQDPREQLEVVLDGYAQIVHGRARRQHSSPDLAALVHRDQHVAQAQQLLHDLIRDVLTEAARTGDIRDDVTPDELATFCLNALNAAGDLPTKAAVGRLVALTLDAMRADA